MTINELNIFRNALGTSESSGNYSKDFNEYWGKYQFGEARRIDIEKMLGLPHLTREQFTPEMQETFFNAHINDLEKRIFNDKLDKFFGQSVTGKKNGITSLINKYGLLGGAHLGGYSGMKHFLTSNYSYDPADSLGTHISDYVAKFSIEKKTLICPHCGKKIVL